MSPPHTHTPTPLVSYLKSHEEEAQLYLLPQYDLYPVPLKCT